MQIVDTVVERPIEACWRSFTDTTCMTEWVPGLCDVRVIETDDAGLPLEIQFELAAGLLYSLVYTYERENHLVRWEPRVGELGAVRGFARFERVEGGTRFTYALEHQPGRRAAAKASDDPHMFVEAFARWLNARK